MKSIRVIWIYLLLFVSIKHRLHIILFNLAFFLFVGILVVYITQNKFCDSYILIFFILVKK